MHCELSIVNCALSIVIVLSDALERDAAGHAALEVHFGAEEDAVALDLRCGVKVLGLHVGLRVALALEGHLQASQVVEHHHLSGEERLEDEGFDAGQHGLGVGLGHGGGVAHVIREVVEGIFAGLHGLGRVLVGTLCTVGVLHFADAIVDHVVR